MKKETILIADDEEKIRQIVKKYLEKEGFSVLECVDGLEAIQAFTKHAPDLVILDIMMPGADGWEVCRELRKTSKVPIIMLTAREDEVDRVLGLEMGADDYVVKPFSPRELMARVKAVLRRLNDRNLGEKENILSFEGLTINLDARKVTINDKEIILTPKEFDILYFLAKSSGKAYSRDHILLSVWGDDYFGDTRTVDTHINRLREKLAKANNKINYINTVWGVGYKFEPVVKNDLG
ncbi:response regulator transcription factor [Desulfoscipio geothermicus]|uniref:Stage 0 sporulation protein A homolog n=1 Tax=Desulfoscipio geothermicus DSM 3669 TaxID=1121426 RepID=A0A1I6DV60_9FIRM|nr:two-component system, OmpR family, response regulator ResD [Desulfoscipio geothermicus DSM 3669]